MEPKYDRVTFCGKCQWELAFGIDLCPQCGARQGPRSAEQEAATDAPDDLTAGGMVIATGIGLAMLIAAFSSRRPSPVLLPLGYALFSIGAGWLILRSAVKSAIIAARRVTHPDS